MSAIPQPLPIPQACHECGGHFAGIVCPVCKTERPAWRALKNIAARERGIQPLSDPLPACRYSPAALCDCGQRGLCLNAA